LSISSGAKGAAKMPNDQEIDNLRKLQDAGIVGPPASLSDDDKKVIASLSPEEINAWVRIKEKLNDAPIKDLPSKFFI
jgi:hypothetical protein